MTRQNHSPLPFINKIRLKETPSNSPVPFKKNPGLIVRSFILQEMEENMQGTLFGTLKKLFTDFIHRVISEMTM